MNLARTIAGAIRHPLHWLRNNVTDRATVRLVTAYITTELESEFAKLYAPPAALPFAGSSIEDVKRRIGGVLTRAQAEGLLAYNANGEPVVLDARPEAFVVRGVLKV